MPFCTRWKKSRKDSWNQASVKTGACRTRSRFPWASKTFCRKNFSWHPKFQQYYSWNFLGTLCDVSISEVAAVMVGTFEYLNCWSGLLTLNADTFAIKHWELQFGDCFVFVVASWFSPANVCVCICVLLCAGHVGWTHILAQFAVFSLQFLLSGFCLGHHLQRV